jgi:hypothetical protein
MVLLCRFHKLDDVLSIIAYCATCNVQPRATIGFNVRWANSDTSFGRTRSERARKNASGGRRNLSPRATLKKRRAPYHTIPAGWTLSTFNNDTRVSPRGLSKRSLPHNPQHRTPNQQRKRRTKMTSHKETSSETQDGRYRR